LPEARAASGSTFPLATAILDELGKQMPFMLKAARQGHGTPLSQRLPELEFVAEHLRDMADGESDWIARAVKSYVVLSLEFLKLQRKLEETGRYLFSSERETLANVYSSERVFGDYYLAGLLLSEALWPNHHRFGEGFSHEFLSGLPPNARVLEVGVGSGYHLAKLLGMRPDVRYTGVDISQYAIDFARRFALRDKEIAGITFRLANATDGLGEPPASFDAVICGEVLEHVDDPGALLAELRRVIKPGGRAFVTTVAFAANIDHVYLFENAQQIRDLLSACGWEIEQEWVLPVYPQDSAEAHRRPLNYGAIVCAS
jgi:2-polyprenyl-3-methyl-5-hydroxy-6-metoxy-1,4-benzoquinol methylase